MHIAQSLSVLPFGNEIMENFNCDINHHETCWPPVLTLSDVYKYFIHSSTWEPTLQMRERTAAKGAGPRGHAELLTVVDQVATQQ